MTVLLRKLASSAAGLAAFPFLAHGGLITAVPGPDDQGGMLMPMVSILNADNPVNPASGELAISFSPTSIPVLRSLEDWRPGSWFAEEAAWRPDLGSPEGVGGTPAASAGDGDLFNNQYGFTFMAMPQMGWANIPLGKALAIRLVDYSHGGMRAFNYLNAQNRWDSLFEDPGSQVLWNGSMWHNYFTLSADVPAGFYSATFEIFMANQPFSSGTGPADYSGAALLAEKDANFTPVLVTYTFRVVRPDGITFTGWLESNLSADELANPEKTDPAADPGGHGIPNLLRYAFGLDARNPDREAMPAAESADGHLGLRFHQRTNALDLQFRIERTVDLLTWETAPVETMREVAVDGTVDSVTVFELESIGQSDRGFLRVSVELHELP